MTHTLVWHEDTLQQFQYGPSCHEKIKVKTSLKRGELPKNHEH